MTLAYQLVIRFYAMVVCLAVNQCIVTTVDSTITTLCFKNGTYLIRRNFVIPYIYQF